MKNNFSEKQEQEWYEKFDQGVTPGDDPQGKHLFKVYKSIHRGIHSLETPSINSKSILKRLDKEMETKIGWFQWINHTLNRLPTPAYAMICIILLFSGLMNSKQILDSLLNTKHGIEKISFYDTKTNQLVNTPFIWRSRLQQQRFVTVPDGVTAELQLAEDSIIHCSPETQFAIHHGKHRGLNLRSGSITAQVAHIPGSAFTVETPLGQIEVIGTVFHVTVQHPED